jgi:glycosyltransferase involved in cell wall biosynthesis
MHLVALVGSPEHVCCRYRLSGFRPWFEENGHHLDLHPWPRRCGSRLRLARVLRVADVVILQRKLLPLWLLYLLRSVSRRLIFDYDDAVFLRDSYSPRGLHSIRRLHRFIATVETVDAVAAGNAYLAAEASRWTSPRNVEMMPTCVEPARYPRAQHRRRGKGVELVWVGSSSTLRGLESATSLLEAIGREVPGVQLKLVCDRFLSLRDLSVLCCPWSEVGEAEAIASADIGISWLPDDLWSRGKCGLKVLQYMAAGLPVVANPVGVQAELVREGETGYLVRTPREWIEAICRLASDPELRCRMGAAARQRVETEFSVAAGAARWRHLLSRWQRPPSSQDAA